ncbi:outer membrane protein [Bradyrhizobium guangxiense]
MRRNLLAAAAIGTLLAAPAFAADLAVPHIYTKAPPVAVDPGYNWSGFYAGLNIGYGWGRSAATTDFIDGGGALLSSSAGTFNLNGVTGGGQIGYNWQRGMFVAGIEADFQGGGQKGRFGALCAAAPDGLQDGICTPGHRGDNTFDPALPVTFDLTQKLDWFGTVRGRLGVAVTPRVLLYGTGGLAYGHITTSGSVSAINVGGFPGADGGTFTPVAASFASSTTKVGWTAGSRRRRRLCRQLERAARISLCRSRNGVGLADDTRARAQWCAAGRRLSLARHGQRPAFRRELSLRRHLSVSLTQDEKSPA